MSRQVVFAIVVGDCRSRQVDGFSNTMGRRETTKRAKNKDARKKTNGFAQGSCPGFMMFVSVAGSTYHRTVGNVSRRQSQVDRK
jgi:hypothetical protein